jgi:hypothetical protein
VDLAPGGQRHLAGVEVFTGAADAVAGALAWGEGDAAAFGVGGFRITTVSTPAGTRAPVMMRTA